MLILIPAVFWLIFALLPTFIGKYCISHRLSRQSTGDKNLLLTFDDGPDSRYTPVLLELLEEYGIHALFFLPGRQVEENRELVYRIKEAGHSLGVHSYAHGNPVLMGPLSTVRDWHRSMLSWERLGIKPQCCRPPHGTLNLMLLCCCRKARLPLFFWSLIAGDWLNRGGQVVLERLKNGTHPGAVILLHDAGEHTGGEPGAPACTIAALRSYIFWALAQGYNFVDPGDYLYE